MPNVLEFVFLVADLGWVLIRTYVTSYTEEFHDGLELL